LAVMHLLVVEDSADMASVLRRALGEESYDVDVADTGQDAVAAVEHSAYDAIVLDVMLPDIDGFEVCRRIRALGCGAPTLMLTARDRLDDRIAGLDAGADDYLTKPFALPELFARLRALLRRGPIERPALLRVGDLVLDPARRTVRRGTVTIPLRSREFDLLEYLMRHPGIAISRETLYRQVWSVPYTRGAKRVDVQVHFLRQKIDARFGRSSLESVRGVGYRIRAS
jgi:two-component system, OmpR family, response regulator